ncbi:DUF7455 domain-containing protein [Couchioplanes caeruleus]|uniref:DUF7455 domain-containing protein n=2 Tax=Couchioplanes caeruleus TaxID=56438 RepID=A0A1K0F9X3_9ACTN|nr:hypothetical protein [Couchioplanes caeruleus]OJF09669.1 hypothetical protein BG844_36225 [Couchioplanes caeruleus subsp. caeruleus]ROP31750.1 hypothetical protein EDD30_4673 [Couchioplanes caeruleus]
MTTVLSPEIVVVDSLAERCDRCGAAAKLELSLAGGGSLAFCGHHANRYADRLVPMAAKAAVEDGFEWAGRSHSV